MFSYFLLFYFTRTMKIITDRRRLVLTEESPTTTDDNNKLAVFAGYYTRCLFPLSAFLNGVAGICNITGCVILQYPPESHQLKRNQDTCIRILSGMLRMRFAVLQYFFSSQELSCRHKPFSNSKLNDPSASSGTPHSREMTDPQPGMNSEYLELETVSSKCRIVCVMSDCCLVEGLYALI